MYQFGKGFSGENFVYELHLSKKPIETLTVGGNECVPEYPAEIAELEHYHCKDRWSAIYNG